MKSELILVAALGVILSSSDARAFCKSINLCSINDFRAARAVAKDVRWNQKKKHPPKKNVIACKMLFITNNFNRCMKARDTIKTLESCGGANGVPGIPACEKETSAKIRRQNMQSLKRGEKCLEDRVEQQEAFKSGLGAVTAARQKWLPRKPQGEKAEVTKALNKIETTIVKGQPGHEDEIRGVRNAIANCNYYIK